MARTVLQNNPNTAITGSSNTASNTEGIVESVEDIISLISPEDTPFYSQIDKVEAKDIIHYWQMDELATPSRTGKSQGWEPTAAADWNSSSPGMKKNYCQLFIRTARVSGTGKSVQYYGRGDSLDYEIMKRGLEIRRDIEATALGTQAGVVPSTTAASATFPNMPAGAAAGMNPAESLIYAVTATSTTANARMAGNHNVGLTGDVTGDAGTTDTGLTYTDGTSRDLAELAVLNAQAAANAAGGKPNWLLCSPFQATKVANFAYIDPTAGVNGTRARHMDGGDATLYNVVDIYKSPYGTLSVVQDLFVRGSVSGDTANKAIVYLLETDKWAIAQLRPMQSEMLAKSGDNEKAMVLAECTLIHRNTKASASIRDLNTV